MAFVSRETARPRLLAQSAENHSPGLRAGQRRFHVKPSIDPPFIDDTEVASKGAMVHVSFHVKQDADRKAQGHPLDWPRTKCST